MSGLRATARRALARRVAGPRRRVRVTIRVPTQTHQQVKRLAIHDRCPASQLMQALIIFGATLAFHALRKPERLEWFKTVASTHLALNRLDQILSGRPSSQSHRWSGGTRLATVRLPPGLLDDIDMYAKVKGNNRSQQLVDFLEVGLRIYAESKLALTEAVGSLNKTEPQSEN